MGIKKHGDWFFDDDENIDYTNQISAAVAAGDLARAGYLEKSRNTKIDYYGMPYAKTYEYQDYIPDIGNKSGKKSADSSSSSPLSRFSKGQSAAAYDMNGIMNTIQNKKFSYNPESDALFKSIKDNYKESAGLVTEDVLGQYAAMTGGIPSSYAVSAATAAGNQHMQKADDLIPELYQLAYGKFADEKSDLYKQYGILADKEQQDYNRRLYEDETAYNRQVYEDETAYKRKQDEAAAIASANEAQTENDRWWAEFYADQMGEEYDRLNDSQKQYASLVFDMVESGNVPSDEMMAMAGINLSGQQFYDNYRNNYSWQLGQKSKYNKSSSVKTGDEEPKKPTDAMYNAIDKIIEDGGDAGDILKKLSHYDVEEWDLSPLYDYAATHGGYDFDAETARQYAEKVNKYYKKKRGDDFVALVPNDDGTYTSHLGTKHLIKYVYEDGSLSEEEANMLLYDYFGITERDINEALR